MQKLREALAAVVLRDATCALVRLGDALLHAYDEAKRLKGALDFDDLVLTARDLLRRPGVAPWVLFKLDGGLDHILIDEAQDTNPEQWEIVAALAEEFFAGEGARDRIRTIFAVGDAKQSIYSFQRADPRAFSAHAPPFSSSGSVPPIGTGGYCRSTSRSARPSQCCRRSTRSFATPPRRTG